MKSAWPLVLFAALVGFLILAGCEEARTRQTASPATSPSPSNAWTSMPTVSQPVRPVPVSIPCPVCDGTGRKYCAPCAGEGWIHNFNDLAFPNANGRSTCYQCYGSGRCFCYHCGGTGWLQRN